MFGRSDSHKLFFYILNDKTRFEGSSSVFYRDSLLTFDDCYVDDVFNLFFYFYLFIYRIGALRLGLSNL